MVPVVSSIAGGLRATRNLVFDGLKWTAHRNPKLLASVRALRKVKFSKNPEPPMLPNLLAGLNPLHPDEKSLAAFADISPALRDEMMAEFIEIARVLRNLETGVSDGYRILNHYSIDPQFSVCKDLNIVYAPPKVGGCTIAASVRRHPLIQSPVHHVHYISSKGIAYVERMINRFNGGGWHENLLQARWFRVLIAINRALRAKHGPWSTTARKPFLIAGAREPVALNLSHCFDGWKMYSDTRDILTAQFVHERLAKDAWHIQCNNWYRNDLKETFGVDVFARPFPIERGWDIYENDAARVLLIRQENLARLSDALGALYGLDPSLFSVVSSNMAESKEYADQYDRVKKTLRLSTQELDEVYSTPYVQHFYTPKEIAAFKGRWQANGISRKAA